MAVTGLLALLDDIATLLDDVAIMSKVAVKKTAGVLGDDLALNAEQVTGISAARELPVVWAVAKGSALNKAILVPAALLINAFLPWLVNVLLMCGGAFLCYEGIEKLVHKFLHSKSELDHEHQQRLEHIADEKVDIVAFEKDKIKGAIRTDFILSAEIIVITLGVVKASPFIAQLSVLIGISALITVGVYGLVAAIVKMDDVGLHLLKAIGSSPVANIQRAVGKGLLVFAPNLMKLLSIVGTAAMFMVGGGILVHGLPWVAEIIHQLEHALPLPLMNTVLSALFGLAVGAVLLAIVMLISQLRARL